MAKSYLLTISRYARQTDVRLFREVNKMKEGDYIVARWQSIKALKRWLWYIVNPLDVMFLCKVDGHPARLLNYGLPTYFQIAVSKN